ncbi:hypothetical protein NDU88_006741 [Pleurodeles waltl]|uniref:Uncharacterized protein n=1 Tax=Pleurodeles waltl TaxID=8319 RepID=A0AAV7QPG9_PLEWA|nr:hypothetical protein NDU88_006741 [Pleurodeles waltl]
MKGERNQKVDPKAATGSWSGGRPVVDGKSDKQDGLESKFGSRISERGFVSLADGQFLCEMGKNISTEGYSLCHFGPRSCSVLSSMARQKGMHWMKLFPYLSKLMVRGQCPDVLLVHIGENDPVSEKGLQILKSMKKDINEMQRQWVT